MASTGTAKIQCRIFQPPKNAMQSGRGRTHGWMLEYVPDTPRRPDPLMGWIAADDTLNQVRMGFSTLEQAIAFADRTGLEYNIEQPKPHRVRPRSYADNFRYIPPSKA